MKIIEIQNLSFTYPGNRTPTLHHVDLELNSGESCCIVGPNGGGKSTLLHLILGLLSPDCGKIKILGKAPGEVHDQVGFMAQYHLLDARFPITAIEVVLTGTLRPGKFLRYRDMDRKTAYEAMEEMGIANLAGQSFSSLSGGQRQRVLLARAIACRPKLLLLDEPTANIDPDAEQNFYETLQKLRRQLTLITVSHDLGFAEANVDKIICVNQSVSIHNSETFNAEAVRELYHHDVNLIRHNHSCFCHCESEAEKKKN